MKKIALLIAGAGHQDGSEITETVFALLALSQCHAKYDFYSIDSDFSVRNHALKQPTKEVRNTLIESNRITRGKTLNIKNLDAKLYDGLIIPGGSGLTQVFCNWSEKGVSFTIQPDIQKIIQDFHQQSKPIGAICIAPLIIAKILGPHQPTLTLGIETNDLTQSIEKMGAHHEACPADDFITDRFNKVITTPAYMIEEASPEKIFKGISGLVKEVVEMA